jgi:hypothetical protein
MPDAPKTNVLIVANRTASTPAMVAEVKRRAGACRFGLMVPPEAKHDWSAEDALRLVGRAARWHHHKLPDRIQHLGVPVTVFPPNPDNWRPVHGFPPEWAPAAVSPAAVAGFGNY